MFKRPLRFAPYYKSVIWGGDKLLKFRGDTTGIPNIGESWEISALPSHESVVVDDEDYAGWRITELCEKYPVEFLGAEVVEKCGTRFPLLFKIIDAKRNLSVQVHPDDALAKERHDGIGKSEMWYIIDCEPDAKIYTGLSAPFRRDEYEHRLKNDSIMEVVGCHSSAPRQFYYVPAGTIHAIGAGNLLAEVQESSDITYRVYDYGRLDSDGRPRELHTELAKDAIDYRYPNDIEPTGTVYRGTTRCAVKSEFFLVDFLDLADAESMKLDPQGRSFLVIMVTEGSLGMRLNDGTRLNYDRGTTLLVPASMPACEIYGQAEGLLVKCGCL